MTARRPLVLVSGSLRELPGGDTLPDGAMPQFLIDGKTADYTLVSSDFAGNRAIVVDSASDVTVSLNTGLTAKEPVLIVQKGTGRVAIGGSATRRNRNGLRTAGQYAVMTILPLGADEYLISGDVTV